MAYGHPINYIFADGNGKNIYRHFRPEGMAVCLA
jgi:hypothetical protein